MAFEVFRMNVFSNLYIPFRFCCEYWPKSTGVKEKVSVLLNLKNVYNLAGMEKHDCHAIAIIWPWFIPWSWYDHRVFHVFLKKRDYLSMFSQIVAAIYHYMARTLDWL